MFNRFVYDSNFLRTLKRKAEVQHDMLGDAEVPYDLNQIRTARTIAEFEVSDFLFHSPFYNEIKFTLHLESVKLYLDNCLMSSHFTFLLYAVFRMRSLLLSMDSTITSITTGRPHVYPLLMAYAFQLW